MSGFDDERTELDDYVLGQLEQHYGKETVKEAAKTAPPPLPKRRRPLVSVGAVACAVAFITGALMFGGVMFAGGLGRSGVPASDTSSAAVSSEVSSLADPSGVSSAEASSAAVSSEISSAETSSAAVSSEISSAEASSAADSSGVSSVEASSAADSSEVSSAQASSAAVSSEISSLADLPEVSSSADLPEVSSSAVSSEVSSVSQQAGYVSRRVDSHPLPSFPDDTEYTAHSTDNSETDPYDNVTTGRRARAGLGIFLMIASLLSAAALYLIVDKQ